MAHLELLDSNGKASGTLLLAEEVKPPGLLFLTTGREPPPRLVSEPGSGYLAAFARTARAWVLLARPGGPALEVNGFPVVGLKVLDPGDQLTAGKLRLRLSGLSIEELSAESLLVIQAKACPICQEPFLTGERAVYCPNCNLAHHADSENHPDHCLHYAGRCGSRPWCGYLMAAELKLP